MMPEWYFAAKAILHNDVIMLITAIILSAIYCWFTRDDPNEPRYIARFTSYGE